MTKSACDDSKKAADETQARNAALRLIRFRPRSQMEVEAALLRRGYPDGLIASVVSRLKSQGLINDAMFAKAWVQGRISRPIGLARLKMELRRKGVCSQDITRALEDIREEYDERAALAALVARKLRDRPARRLAPKDRIHLYNFLRRRGFSDEMISEHLGVVSDANDL